MSLSPETGKPDRFLPPQHQHRHGRQGSPQHLLNRHRILPKVQGQCPGCVCFLSSTRQNSERKEHLEREKVKCINVIVSDLNSVSGTREITNSLASPLQAKQTLLKHVLKLSC